MPIQPQFGGPQNPRWCCMRKVFCMASFMQFHCVSTGVGVRGAGIILKLIIQKGLKKQPPFFYLFIDLEQ